MNKTTQFCLTAVVFVLFTPICIAMRDESDGHRHIHPKMQDDIIIPEIAEGHDETYRRFYLGKLVYKPDPNSDVGRIELSIKDLVNPLDGTFDLSQCGDSGKYLSIATGYRTGKNPENDDKVEVWIAPRFLIEKNLETSATHFKPIMRDWNASTAPVGVFWTWGGWDNMESFDYLTTNSCEDISDSTIYEKWHSSWDTGPTGPRYARLNPRKYSQGRTSVRVTPRDAFHVSF